MRSGEEVTIPILSRKTARQEWGTRERYPLKPKPDLNGALGDTFSG
jgi:hypothetical protein